MPDENSFYGKYRGTVLDNIDPLQSGRLQVEVPDVAGTLPSTWALPCLPFAGIRRGLLRRPAGRLAGLGRVRAGRPGLPDLDRLLLGHRGRRAPARAGRPPGLQQVVIQTTGEAVLALSDTPGPSGGILLQSSSGALISVSDSGIIIDNGQGATITLDGPTVSVNDGALEVT